MDSPYFPIIFVTVASLAVFFGLFNVLWRYFFGPQKIKEAIKARKAPSQIREELAGVNWITASTCSVLMGGGLVLFSWNYFGAWLWGEAVDTLKNQVATWFLKSIWNVPLENGQLPYTPFIAVGCAVGLFFGVLVGTLLGKQWGIKKAARNYYLTKFLLTSNS